MTTLVSAPNLFPTDRTRSGYREVARIQGGELIRHEAKSGREMRITFRSQMGTSLTNNPCRHCGREVLSEDGASVVETPFGLVLEAFHLCEVQEVGA